MVLVQPSYLLEPFLRISWLGIAKTKKKRINRIKFKLQAQIFHVGIFIFLIFFFPLLLFHNMFVFHFQSETSEILMQKFAFFLEKPSASRARIKGLFATAGGGGGGGGSVVFFTPSPSRIHSIIWNLNNSEFLLCNVQDTC